MEAYMDTDTVKEPTNSKYDTGHCAHRTASPSACRRSHASQATACAPLPHRISQIQINAQCETQRRRRHLPPVCGVDCGVRGHGPPTRTRRPNASSKHDAYSRPNTTPRDAATCRPRNGCSSSPALLIKMSHHIEHPATLARHTVRQQHKPAREPTTDTTPESAPRLTHRLQRAASPAHIQLARLMDALGSYNLQHPHGEKVSIER